MSIDIFQKSQQGLYSNPNLLINGDFSIWQRGETHTITGETYTSDRWVVGSTSGTQVARKQLTNATDSIYAKQVMEIQHTNATNIGYLLQRIEEDTSLQGETVTFSGRFNFLSNQSDIVVASVWLEVGGAAASPFVRSTMHATSGFAEVGSVTFTVPSITSYDENKEYFLGVSLEYANGGVPANGNYYFGNLKLERGPVATPFVPDDPATNLAKCQRYYTKIACRVISNAFAAGSSVGSVVPLPVTMRTLRGANITNTGWYGNANLNSQLYIEQVGEDSLTYYSHALGSGTAYGSVTISVDAEL